MKLLASGPHRDVAVLATSANVELVDIPTNDCWIRDFGPTFVACKDKTGCPLTTIEGIDWKYNAWGGKYPPWDLDSAAAREICRRAATPHRNSRLCLEGGALETDGLGRLISTPNCLLTDTRNPGWSAADISNELRRWLGIHEILWLSGGGLSGDDTDGHVDQLARFVDAQNVVAAVCQDPGDANHSALEHNFQQLHRWAETTRPSVQIHRLPIPPARFLDGRRLPESYCNFLRLGKERLLVPTFSAATDDAALRLLGELSGADVTAVDCQNLVWGLGALHCASRDQPAP